MSEREENISSSPQQSGNVRNIGPSATAVSAAFGEFYKCSTEFMIAWADFEQEALAYEALGTEVQEVHLIHMVYNLRQKESELTSRLAASEALVSTYKLELEKNQKNFETLAMKISRLTETTETANESLNKIANGRVLRYESEMPKHANLSTVKKAMDVVGERIDDLANYSLRIDPVLNNNNNNNNKGNISNIRELRVIEQENTPIESMRNNSVMIERIKGSRLRQNNGESNPDYSERSIVYNSKKPPSFEDSVVLCNNNNNSSNVFNTKLRTFATMDPSPNDKCREQFVVVAPGGNNKENSEILNIKKKKEIEILEATTNGRQEQKKRGVRFKEPESTKEKRNIKKDKQEDLSVNANSKGGRRKTKQTNTNTNTSNNNINNKNNGKNLTYNYETNISSSSSSSDTEDDSEEDYDDSAYDSLHSLSVTSSQIEASLSHESENSSSPVSPSQQPSKLLHTTSTTTKNKSKNPRNEKYQATDTGKKTDLTLHREELTDGTSSQTSKSPLRSSSSDRSMSASVGPVIKKAPNKTVTKTNNRRVTTRSMTRNSKRNLNNNLFNTFSMLRRDD